MRPRRLVIEGLRSFKSRVEIDFSDKKLLAIVGDTGVGKSSILEAMTYALYRGTTWTSHHGDLISDTEDDMLVELTFDARGKRYRVRQTASRTNRPPVSELYDEAEGTSTDGVGPVKAEIQRLLGLDRDAFLKAVILPQGRFADLLQAAPAERNGVLKNIFRVDDLDQVRKHARTILSRVAPHVVVLKAKRAELPGDPAAALQEARAAATATKEAAKRSVAGLKAARRLDRAVTDARDAERLAVESGSALRAVDLSGIESALAAARAAADEIAGARKEVDEGLTAVGDRMAELAKNRSGMVADGLDTAQLAKCIERLETIGDQLPALADALGELRDDEAAVAADAAGLDTARAAAGAAAQEAARAKDAAGAAEAERRRAELAVTAATGLLAAARSAGREADAAVAAAEAAAKRLAEAEEQKAAADAATEVAAAAHQEAAVELEAVERTHAAAHAAVGSRPGDSCPVCRRELPTGFKPPKAAGIKRVKARSDRLARSRDAARAAAAEAGATLKERTDNLKAAKAALTPTRRRATAEHKKLERAIRATADLDAPDAEILAGVATAAADAARSHAALHRSHEEASERATAAASEVATLEQRIASERNRIGKEGRHIDRQLAHLRRSAARLPDGLRPALPDAGYAGLAPEELRTGPERDLLDDARRRANELADLDTEIERARADTDELRAEQKALDDRERTEVIDLATSAHDDLQTAAQVVSDAERAIGSKGERVSVGRDRSVAGLAVALEAVRARHAELDQEIAAVQAESCERAEAAEDELMQVLIEFDVADLDGLESKRIADEVAAQNAAADVDQAKEHAKKGRQLDRDLKTAGELADDLAALVNLLSQNTFMGELMRRRSTALLAVASRRLDEMSNKRYAFTGDFEILDQRTGQKRPALTLSGGESFVASLALALGMVDLAAQAGGRLESLFLDEGFGALDTTNLHLAVDALEATAKAGRMVAVISHVKAIAERISEVMEVSARATGSQAVWLDEAARAGLSEGDAGESIKRLLD